SIRDCISEDSCSFFFQAEDGIRDGHVTGVQTCALPIYDGIWSSADCPAKDDESRLVLLRPGSANVNTVIWDGARSNAECATDLRSEERRGGEERRCSCGRDCGKESRKNMGHKKNGSYMS